MHPITLQNGTKITFYPIVCVATENYVSDNTTVKKTSIFTDVAELETVLYVVTRSPDLKPTD